MPYLILFIVIVLIIIIILNLIEPFKTFETKKVLRDCNNCGYNSIHVCSECDTCGVCELENKKVCINGNENGPIFEDGCKTYKYKKNDLITNKNGPILSLFTRLHSKNKEKLLNTTTDNATEVAKTTGKLQKELDTYNNIKKENPTNVLIVTNSRAESESDPQPQTQTQASDTKEIDNTGGLGAGILSIIIISGMLGVGIIALIIALIRNAIKTEAK
jgi:hypothetical protein